MNTLKKTIGIIILLNLLPLLFMSVSLFLDGSFMGYFAGWVLDIAILIMVALVMVAFDFLKSEE